jgi:hypothetical protein
MMASILWRMSPRFRNRRGSSVRSRRPSSAPSCRDGTLDLPPGPAIIREDDLLLPQGTGVASMAQQLGGHLPFAGHGIGQALAISRLSVVVSRYGFSLSTSASSACGSRPRFAHQRPSLDAAARMLDARGVRW